MSAYPMPPDTSSKEKIIGGILDWGQLMWVLIGLVIGLIIGGFFSLLGGGFVGIIIGLIPGLIFAFIFCFIKKHQLTMFQYLKYKNKHKKKTKKLPNVRLDALNHEDLNKIRNY